MAYYRMHACTFRTGPADKNVAIIFSQPMGMELMSYQHVLWTPYTIHPVLGLDDVGSPHAGHGMPVCYEKVKITCTSSEQLGGGRVHGCCRGLRAPRPHFLLACVLIALALLRDTLR